MKALTTLIFVFVAILSIAQTSLDMKVFDKINEYRDSLHIPKLEWDSCAYKSANYQATYLKSANGLVTHKNPEKGYESSSDRYKTFGGVNKETRVGDNITYSTVGEITNVILSYKIPKDFITKYSEEELELMAATQIVNVWKKSKDHNKIMTGKNMKFGGCHVEYRSKEVSIFNTEKKIFEKGYTKDFYSVMVLVN